MQSWWDKSAVTASEFRLNTCLFACWFVAFDPRGSFLRKHSIIFSPALRCYLYPVFSQTSPQWSWEFEGSSNLIWSIASVCKNIIPTQVGLNFFFSTHELLSAQPWHVFEFLWGFKNSVASDCNPPFHRWDTIPETPMSNATPDSGGLVSDCIPPPGVHGWGHPS